MIDDDEYQTIVGGAAGFRGYSELRANHPTE